MGFDFKSRWLRSGDVSVDIVPPPSISAFSATREEYAGYVEQEASALDGLILGTGGFRVDGNSQFGNEVSPSWSVAIPVKQIDTTFRGSYSEGFRAPSFDELYFPDFGNPNLQPEISSEYDGGFTTTLGEKFSFTGTYFSRRVHDLIVTVPVPVTPMNPFGSAAGNAGRVDVQGVELVPSVGPFYGFSLSGGFTALDETHVGINEPLRVPKHSAYGLAQYEHHALLLPDDKIVLSLAYTFVGDRDDITPEGTIANHVAFHRFDATATYDAHQPWRFVSNEEVFTRVSNIFDRNYSENFGFPAPPVNFVAGIKLSLNDRGWPGFLSREATGEGRANRLAPGTKIVQQLPRTRAPFIPHPPRQRPQRIGVGFRQRPCRLIALDAQSIFQPRDKLVSVAQSRGFIPGNEFLPFDQFIEQVAGRALSQRAMLMAMRQRHHLGNELHVDQTAAPLLQIEARLALDADLQLHPLPHL